MKTQYLPLLLSLPFLAYVFEPAARAPAESDPTQSKAEMDDMMRKAKKYTTPGKKHKLLERFLGKWHTELRFPMYGKGVEQGKAEFSWLMKGRFLKSESTGTMMRQPTKSFTVLGYDNFKMSYVVTMMSSMDTAIRHAEGDMDPGGKALLMYGTLDEYLTGEHDKMVKYVWRFLSKDKFVLEVHDLPIGEKNTMVVEITYKRAS